MKYTIINRELCNILCVTETTPWPTACASVITLDINSPDFLSLKKDRFKSIKEEDKSCLNLLIILLLAKALSKWPEYLTIPASKLKNKRRNTK